MGESPKPPKLLVTWAILVPLLLIVIFVFSPGLLVSVFTAAVISPLVHSAVGAFYPKKRSSYGSTADWLLGRR